MMDLIKMISFSCTMFVHSIPSHKGMFELSNVGKDLKKKNQKTLLVVSQSVEYIL